MTGLSWVTAATRSTRFVFGARRPSTLSIFKRFSGGDFVAAMVETLASESLTRVLYPDDTMLQGRALRLVQEYFLVACSLADLMRRFRGSNTWRALDPRRSLHALGRLAGISSS